MPTASSRLATSATLDSIQDAQCARFCIHTRCTSPMLCYFYDRVAVAAAAAAGGVWQLRPPDRGRPGGLAARPRQAAARSGRSSTTPRSQSRGSIVGAADSNDRQGWGGVYFVSRYSATTAFLSTSWFKDQNSLVGAHVAGPITPACLPLRVPRVHGVHVAPRGERRPLAIESAPQL